MRNKNICKFVYTETKEGLEVHNFVYESNPNVMKTGRVLAGNSMILVKEGRGYFKIDNDMVAFDTGSLVFAFSGERLCVVSDTPCGYMYIDFTGNRSDILFKRFGINKNNRSFEGYDGMIPLWHESLSRAGESNTDLCAESMLLYSFSRLSAGNAAQNDLINRIIELTEENFSDCELSLADLSAELSYNPKYVSHIFKKKMNVSYTEYLRTLRIKYAVALFDRGIDSIKNVAFLSGFADPLYFSTVFKKTVGVPPKEYIKRKQKDHGAS
ncbi:MAG: helix-turn-helix transcriptional regulator [Clostridia bacterium]|nr:helix-turn-helix transcriptional regulator [Clostridia bacterium]